MFTSLRARLMATYALVISMLICVLSVGIVRSLQANPLAYRQAVQTLQESADQIQESLQPSATERDAALFLEKKAEETGLWLMVVRRPDVLISNTRESDVSLFNLRRAVQNFPNDPERVYRFADAQKQTWLFTLRRIDADTFLFAGILQPRLAALTLFRNELVDPILKAGAAALVLAILFSLTLSAWIANPLQRMSKAAQSLAHGSGQKLPLEGPREVQQLGGSLNQMADQVKASQDSQRDFIANVSHELKTPLTSIQGYAQALSDGTVSSAEDVRKAADVILTESQRMNRLVIDLLSLARLEAGTADLEKGPLDLQSLLSGLTEQFAFRARELDVRLETQLDAVPEMMGDGDRLAQVFSNLLDNALKFTPAGGTIKVSCQRNGNWIETCVIDSGTGIPAEDLGRVFERFYQVEKSRRRSGTNSAGLGLSIARQIVLAHAGDISAQSEVGQGSVFMVKLPVLSPQEGTQTRKKAGG
ncbi:MAG: HAMP domain-containing protein [Chloroflexi bacterium]|nr:HAMP domain-containing protein [Chloroflexota bacterium]